MTIIIPSTTKISHDHTYAKQTDKLTVSEENDEAVLQENDDMAQEENQHDLFKYHTGEDISNRMEMVINSLQLTHKERQSLEEGTRGQSDSVLWHYARAYRITGSKCGRILVQKNKTKALLQFVLYPKPFDATPKPIEWGKINEDRARDAYIGYMRSHGHPRITVEIYGFFVHKEKYWLGASPDARVHDPDNPYPHGIAELKCPFSKADVTVEVACKDP